MSTDEILNDTWTSDEQNMVFFIVSMLWNPEDPRDTGCILYSRTIFNTLWVLDKWKSTLGFPGSEHYFLIFKIDTIVFTPSSRCANEWNSQWQTIATLTHPLQVHGVAKPWAFQMKPRSCSYSFQTKNPEGRGQEFHLGNLVGLGSGYLRGSLTTYKTLKIAQPSGSL